MLCGTILALPFYLQCRLRVCGFRVCLGPDFGLAVLVLACAPTSAWSSLTTSFRVNLALGSSHVHNTLLRSLLWLSFRIVLDILLTSLLRFSSGIESAHAFVRFADIVNDRLLLHGLRVLRSLVNVIA